MKTFTPEERLDKALRHLPAQKLLSALRSARAKGRNDYPIETLWSALLKSFSHQSPSIEALRPSNPDLPPPSALSRFLTRLQGLSPLFEEMHALLVDQLPWSGILTFGEMILESPSSACDEGEKRLFDQATNSCRLIKWKGYRLHYILDAKTALPLISSLTPASHSPLKTIVSLLEQLIATHPEKAKACRYAIGDATYDDEELITTLWSRFHIKPLFELARATSSPLSTPLPNGKNGIYNDLGEVFCIHPTSKERLPMTFAGFEEGRSCLKYRCQALSYGVQCKGDGRCAVKQGTRIPLSTDRRLFTPVARSSYKWHTLLSHLQNQKHYHTYLQETLLPKLPFARGEDKLTLYTHLANLTLLSNQF